MSPRRSTSSGRAGDAGRRRPRKTTASEDVPPLQVLPLFAETNRRMSEDGKTADADMVPGRSDETDSHATDGDAGSPREVTPRSASSGASSRHADANGDGGDPPEDADAGLTQPGDRGPLSRMMDGNFLAFASYTICNRAIPAVEDGLKPVQRRILHALHALDDGRFIKVANVVGHTMQYHPHGDASIGDALVYLVNKRYLIEGQGNFGNVFTGDSAAAPRYIECRLTVLARNEIFNPKTTAYIPSYDGRNKEPVLLPSKLPLLLMLGAEGIAVGLSTSILPHNFIELLEAQIKIIQNKPFAVLPDFPTGGLMDVSEYRDGVGRVKVRAVIEPRQHNRLTIRGLPYGTTTESLIASIEDAIRRKKVPVRAINDYTAEKVEVELVLSPGASPERAIKALFAFTACESALTSRIVVLQQNRPREMTVPEILRFNTELLLELLRRELEIRQSELQEAFHNKTLVQIFVEQRIYKRIEHCPTFPEVQQAVLDGFEPFRDRLRRDVTAEDVEMLLGVRIRRISLFDIQKNREEIERILKELADVEANLKALKPFAINYLKRLIKQYRPLYPRQARIDTFSAIEVRSLTAEELTIRFDPETGYLGHGIKAGEERFACSSLDKLILVWDDGRYCVMPPPEKLFVDKNLVYCAIMDRKRQMTLVYTLSDCGFTYLKRFTFGGAILNRDYRCIPAKGRICLLREGTPETLFVKYKPAKGQRIHQQCFTPADVMVKSVNARGIQMTAKPIARISDEKPRGWQDEKNGPNGKLL